MSTPAKSVGKPAKRPAASAGGKAPLSSKRVKKHAKPAAKWGEDGPPTDQADTSAAEATPPQQAATLAKLSTTDRKREHDHKEKEEGDGTEIPPTKRHVGEKSKKPLSQKPAGQNVTKSKESGMHDEEDGGVAAALSLSENLSPTKTNASLDENEKEDKECKKKPVKRKKKNSKGKATPDTTLYLGNLNSERESEEIKKAILHFFTKKGLTVCGVRIGSTKKFGYVNFSTAADLEKALEMNGENILGLECNMKARNKEGLAEITRGREARTLFVKNLPYATTPGDLQDVFANAVNLRLPVRKDGSARGLAYIEFESEAEADKAFMEKQGADVKGRHIILDYTGDKSRKRMADLKTLVVNNISKKATESSLKEVFQKAIAIRIKQHNNVKQKGVALVEFSTEEDAKEALKLRYKAVIEGLKVNLVLQGAQPTQTKTLFVRGLSGETTENSLRKAFGGAVSCRIATDHKTGVCKGFGFVDFSTAKDASAAKEAMEGFEIDGDMVTLEFARQKLESSRGFGGRSEVGGRGDRGHGRGGNKVVEGGGDDVSSMEVVKGGNTGKQIGGKKAEKGKKIGRGGSGKLGFGKERDESNTDFVNRKGGRERGIRGFGGRAGSSRGVGGGKSGSVGTGGGRGGSERGRGGFGGKGAGASKSRFGSKGEGGVKGGLGGRGGSAYREK